MFIQFFFFEKGVGYILLVYFNNIYPVLLFINLKINKFWKFQWLDRIYYNNLKILLVIPRKKYIRKNESVVDIIIKGIAVYYAKSI